MKYFKTHIAAYCALALSHSAYADGLSDLNSTLDRLAGTAPISATLHSSFVEHEGKGKEREKKEGKVSVSLSDGQDGLMITYSNDVLTLIEKEAHLRVEDEEAKTPTLSAVNGIRTTDLNNRLSASESMKRQLKRAEFVEETPAELNGKAVRKLTFSLPMEAMITSKKVREYVSKFSGSYHIMIDDKGTPLQSRLTFKGKGRAYIVLSMEASGDNTLTYTVVEDRLVTLRSENKTAYKSTFGASETVEIDELELQLDDAALVKN